MHRCKKNYFYRNKLKVRQKQSSLLPPTKRYYLLLKKFKDQLKRERSTHTNTQTHTHTGEDTRHACMLVLFVYVDVCMSKCGYVCLCMLMCACQRVGARLFVPLVQLKSLLHVYAPII